MRTATEGGASPRPASAARRDRRTRAGCPRRTGASAGRTADSRTVAQGQVLNPGDAHRSHLGVQPKRQVTQRVHPPAHPVPRLQHHGPMTPAGELERGDQPRQARPDHHPDHHHALAHYAVVRRRPRRRDGHRSSTSGPARPGLRGLRGRAASWDTVPSSRGARLHRRHLRSPSGQLSPRPARQSSPDRGKVARPVPRDSRGPSGPGDRIGSPGSAPSGPGRAECNRQNRGMDTAEHEHEQNPALRVAADGPPNVEPASEPR